MKLITKRIKNKYLLILLASVVLLVALPGIYTAWKLNLAREEIAPILANVTYGSNYYNARLREIKSGNIFIGNPYFLEHSQEAAPAFFVADWLAAAPALLGLPLAAAVIFNAFFWPLIFILLAYRILRELSFSAKAAVLGAALVYSQAYFLMLPPVSMQTVFPFWLFFLFAFVRWLKEPPSRRRIIFLAVAGALAFYVYTYLWQIALTMLFLSLFWLIITRQRRPAVSMLAALAGVLALSIPLFFYTIKQISHPYYWETMERIGLTFTHLPAADAYYAGRWILLAVLLWLAAWFWVRSWRQEKICKLAVTFFSVSGLALLAVSISNIITGKDLELTGHVARFMAVWLPLSLACFVYLAVKKLEFFKVLTVRRKLALAVILLISLFGLPQYFISYWNYFTGSNGSLEIARELRAYLPALSWLDKTAAAPRVIWVDPGDSMQLYIPMLTKHYALFAEGGGLHLMSSAEMEERYLTASYFKDLTPADLVKDWRIFAGVGNAVHHYQAYNRKIKLCRLFFGAACQEVKTAAAWRGTQYFNDLRDRYAREIKPNIQVELTKFQVAYLVLNKRLEAGRRAERSLGARGRSHLIYEDDNFLIYNVN